MAPVGQTVGQQAYQPQPTVYGQPPPGTSYPAPGAYPNQQPVYGMPYMNYAGFWIRVGAYLIDSLIFAIPFGLIIFSIISSMGGLVSSMPHNPNAANAIADAIRPWGILGDILWLAYVICLTAIYGATLGKMALGLRVVKSDGRPVSWGTAIGRCLLESVFGTLCGLTYLVVAFTAKKQGLHDMIMDTVVIHTR